MKSDSWTLLQELFDSAVRLEPSRRREFLDQACAGDPELRSQLESLLDADGSNHLLDAVVEHAAIDFVGAETERRKRSSLVGQDILHYRIIGELGGGGMGVVYKAEDQRLDRLVALKFLLPEYAKDPDALERLRREARAASSLNHPHICTIHDINEHNGQPFIVMELLEGSTLKQAIENGPLETGQVLDFGAQIADAVAAAHEKGVLHRDIKSSNIFVTDRGVAKVLDFGVAKVNKRELRKGETQRWAELTNPGTTVGTLSCMSPEQALGKELDVRSDIFSLGVVLYEMATAKMPFNGETPAAVFDAILHGAPVPPSRINPRSPPALDRVIEKALAKNPEDRHQSASELRSELAQIRSGVAVKAPPKNRRYAAGLIAVGIVLVVVLLLARPWSTPQEQVTTAEPAKAPAAAQVSPIQLRRSVAVLGFKNLNANPAAAWLSTALSDMLTTELGAGSNLRTIPGESIARAKIELALTESDAFAKDTLERIRQSLGADTVVAGSYLLTQEGAGAKIRLDARVQDTQTGETIGLLQDTADRNDLLELVSRTGSVLRDKFGAPALSTPDAARLQALQPSSVETAKLHAEGLSKIRTFELTVARELFESELELDPENALVHAALADVLTNLGYDRLARERAQRAFDLSEKLPRQDRLRIEANLHMKSSRWDKAGEILESLYRFYPDGLDYALQLVEAQVRAGKAKEALATLDGIRRLPPPLSADLRIDLADAGVRSRLSDYKAQQEIAARAAKTASERGARLLYARARYQEGEAFTYLRRHDPAMAALNEAKQIFFVAGDKAMLADTVNVLAILYSFQNKADLSQKSFEEVLAIGQETGSQALMYRALNNISVVLAGEGKVAESNRALLRSIEIKRQVAEKDALTSSYMNLAEGLWEEGDIENAQKYYELCASLSEEVGRKIGVSAALYGLGRLFIEKERFAEARANLTKALAIQTEIADVVRQDLDRIALANLAVAEGKPAEAESAMRELLARLKDKDQPDIKGNREGGSVALARALLARGNVKGASDVFAEAEADKLFGTRIRPLSLSRQVVRARIKAAEGQTAEAVQILNTVITDARKIGYLGPQFEARLALGQIEVETGKVSAGRERLSVLAREARAKGFLRTARQAASS
jgi:tetratricopeptide (TPR) repeat protein/TolB-like protein